ncbi:MAG: substrate-binding domain-containing protein [Anaerolineae bacterium]|nr:substrate-binding domain-containing protein [Anaerolineae bacterium]
MNRSYPRRMLWAAMLAIMLIVSACGSNSGGVSSSPTNPPANALTIKFLYTSEKKAWVEAATQAFNAANYKTASGKIVQVELEVTGSVESVTRIVDGSSQPALWSPASRLVIPILNDEWVQKNGTELVDDGQCKDGVLSPLVIMMWQPFAEALGWPKQQIGWADIAKLATSPNGWADYGKPQWGAFRFGHTHPDYSNSGLQTIVALAYAATGKLRGLSESDVTTAATADFIKKVESSVAHYGSSTGFFGTAMIERGPTYLSAAAVYESVVVSSYSAIKKSTDGFPLVAIYPKEGTFMSDHPLCIPNAAWVTSDQKEAAGIYRDYLLSKPIQEQALQLGFRPGDTDIAIASPIDIDHGVDPTQPQNLLAVPSAATTRAIRTVWSEQKRQVNLTMLIDISGSMKNENRIAGAREGAAAFIQQLAPTDNLTIILFDDKQTILYDNVNVGEKRDDMIKDVGTIVPKGGTALFDSIAVAVETMKKDPTRINAVVVMTDGQDTNSERYRQASGLMDALTGNPESSDSDVSIFTIGYGSDADENVLKTIADRGRGAYFKGTVENIAQVYRDMSTFF